MESYSPKNLWIYASDLGFGRKRCNYIWLAFKLHIMDDAKYEDLMWIAFNLFFLKKKCLRQRLHMFWASRLSSGPSLKLEDCKVNGYSMLRLIAFDFSNPAPFCNSFSKAPSLRTLQSLFSLSIAVSISGFNHSFAFWVFHYYFTRHLSTDPPFPHPFGLGLHEYSPFRCISPCLGSRCSRPWVEKQKNILDAVDAGSTITYNIYIYTICSIPWHAVYDYYFSTADL